MVRLRFMRMGKKNRPHYRLCAMDSRWPRDGKYLEWLGVYDPLIEDDAKKARINKERTEYWLSVGAQPTQTVYSFLKDADVQGLVRLKKPKHKRPGGKRAEAAPGAVSTRKPKPPKKPRAVSSAVFSAVFPPPVPPEGAVGSSPAVFSPPKPPQGAEGSSPPRRPRGGSGG